jgi:hypothetical protein
VNNDRVPFQFVDQPATWRDADALIVHIPSAARGKRKLLGVLADRLKFPRYFGWNWDALEECLRDLSWLENVKQIAVVHESIPLSARGHQLSIYLSVLADAVAFRRQTAQSPSLVFVFPAEHRGQIETAMSDSPRS